MVTKTVDVPQNIQSIYDKQADPEAKCEQIAQMIKQLPLPQFLTEDKLLN